MPRRLRRVVPIATLTLIAAVLWGTTQRPGSPSSPAHEIEVSPQAAPPLRDLGAAEPSPRRAKPTPRPRHDAIRVVVYPLSDELRLPWTAIYPLTAYGLEVREGAWAEAAMSSGRVLHAPPAFAQATLEAMGATPGRLAELLAPVDPWLAASAARAEWAWEWRSHHHAFEEASQAFEARYGEPPYNGDSDGTNDRATRDPEARTWWREHAPDHDADRLRGPLEAIEQAHPGHPAADLAALQWLAAGRGSRDLSLTIRVLARSRDPDITARLGTSLYGRSPDRYELEPEDVVLLEQVARTHPEPAVRGAAAQLGLLFAHQAADQAGVDRHLALLDDAAQACASEPEQEEFLLLHGCGSASTTHEMLRDQLLALGDVAPRTWQEAVRLAALRCTAGVEDGLLASGVGRFEGAWDWSWPQDGALQRCIAQELPPPYPAEGTTVRLDVVSGR